MLNILNDIENQLKTEKWKENALKTIDLYRKNLEISNNRKIKNLIEIQKAYIKKYGETAPETITINKKIDEEIRKIYNS
jgi:hypothetical protein